jgi:hypothetical protein
MMMMKTGSVARKARGRMRIMDMNMLMADLL